MRDVGHEDGEETWALVETHKGIGGIYTYTGRVLRADLEAWRRGELRGALTLRSAYWIEEDADTGRRAPVVVGRHPSFRNGNGVMHIAAPTVILVMELRAPDPGVLDTESGGRVVRLGAIREPRHATFRDAPPGAEESLDESSGDDGAGDDGAGDDGAGDDGAGDDGASDDGAGDHGAGDDGASDDGASDDGAGDDGAGGAEAVRLRTSRDAGPGDEGISGQATLGDASPHEVGEEIEANRVDADET
ncbi:MAG: hypothetical protein KF901_31635 [Myxococcales bacterium]|nr:hypothetical protein [Myxococcales bacterium]